MHDSAQGIEQNFQRPPSPGVDGGQPLYRQVKDAMLLSLSRGEWKQGEALPPEKELAGRFGISIGTLRKAIDELVTDRLLLRHQGKGTFVAIHAHNKHYFRFFHLVRMDGHKSYPSPRLARFAQTRATALQRQKLGLEPGAEVFEFSNVISLNGQIVSVDDISLPVALFPGLTREQLLERPSTIYHFYQEAYGINVVGTDERLRAAAAHGAHARWLEIAAGTPVLEIRRVAYSYHAQPVEWRVTHVHTDHYEYLAQEAQEAK